MSSHRHPPHVTRVVIACSPTYRNRRAIMEALGSIFLETIEEQREYYYFECPAMSEIFDDGVFNRLSFRQLTPGDQSQADVVKLGFTHIVAGGDDTFVGNLLSELGATDALLVRLA
ncbi:MAG: hypothetical protein JSR99_10115 [Proteobacteria bacterium]|nr:hypothetical protein [Pseudomonadota bacterium]